MVTGSLEMIEGRTVESPPVHEYVFGDFRIDFAAFQLWRGNQAISLTPKGFDTLALLIKNRDRAVSKEELLHTIWPGSTVTEDSLTQVISALRKALGDDTAHPTLISTLARRGYRFIAPVIGVPAEHPPADAEPRAAAGFAPAPSPAEPPAVSESRRNEAAPRPVAVQAGPSERTPVVVEGSRGLVLPTELSRNWKPQLRAALLGAAVACAICMTLAPRGFFFRREGPAVIPPLRFSVSAPEKTSLSAGGILSPNGRYVLLLAEDDNSRTDRIWIRSLDSFQSRPVPGTEGASRPFWSPDSQLIGFFAGGKLKRVGIDNQPAQVITATGTSSSGATWSSKGVILFAEVRSGLYSVSESGGTPVPVTTLKEGEVAHRWAQFLPDGDHFCTSM